VERKPSIRLDGYTARRVAKTIHGHKTLVEDETGRIPGAHVVDPHGDEIINIFALAIHNDLTADQIKQTIFSYPTSASDVGYML
jgi:glutathione reductase (NADPH)